MPLFRDEGGKDAPPEGESDRATRRAKRSLETLVDTFVEFWIRARESCISKEMSGANFYREQLEKETLKLVNEYRGFPEQHWDACHAVLDLARQALQERDQFEVGDLRHSGEVQTDRAEHQNSLHSVPLVDLRTPVGSEVSRAGDIGNPGLGTFRLPGGSVQSVCDHIMDQVAEYEGELGNREAVHVGTSLPVSRVEAAQAERSAASLGTPLLELTAEATHVGRVQVSRSNPILTSPLRPPRAERTQPSGYPRSPQKDQS